MAVASADDGHQ